MIKLNEMLFKQRIEISPQIVCGINNVIILHINNAGTATQKQGLITFLSSSFTILIARLTPKQNPAESAFFILN